MEPHLTTSLTRYGEISRFKTKDLHGNSVGSICDFVHIAVQHSISLYNSIMIERHELLTDKTELIVLQAER